MSGTRLRVQEKKVRAKADLFCFSSYIQNSSFEEFGIGKVVLEVVWNQWINFGKA